MHDNAGMIDNNIMYRLVVATNNVIIIADWVL